VPRTVVESVSCAPISSSAVVAVYSFSTDAGGRAAVARSANSGAPALMSYT
jgi:hypothetical protein